MRAVEVQCPDCHTVWTTRSAKQRCPNCSRTLDGSAAQRARIAAEKTQENWNIFGWLLISLMVVGAFVAAIMEAL